MYIMAPETISTAYFILEKIQVQLRSSNRVSRRTRETREGTKAVSSSGLFAGYFLFHKNSHHPQIKIPDSKILKRGPVRLLLFYWRYNPVWVSGSCMDSGTFVIVDFSRVGLLVPRATLNLRTREFTRRLAPTLWHGWPYQELVCIRGWPQEPALAPRHLKIYCASPFD
jgi:hypothetical protein